MTSADETIGPASGEVIDGLNRDAVEDWLAANVRGAHGPFDFELIAGGRSNLTFRVRDRAGGSLILRRPPLGEILETAHDVAREHRILTALQPTPVPTPAVYGLCEDPAVTGAKFFVMEDVDGVVIRKPEDAEEDFTPAQRREVAESLIDALASIHNTSPEAVGLGGLARHDRYLERQLSRWKRQYDQVRGRDIPAIDEVYERLIRAQPAQQRVAIVHGDYRLDNTVVAPTARIAAVLDWELCTLGDPLADLGGLLVSWVEPGEEGAHMLGRTPSKLPGFPPRAEIVAAYADRTGLDVSDAGYYSAFAYWRLACIGEGVYRRFLKGSMSDSADVPVEALGEQVLILSEAALRHFDRT